MEISKRSEGDLLVLEVQGRIDGYWAGTLRTALDEEVRSGAHEIHVDLNRVDFLSSSGVRVLVQTFRQMQELRGKFGVVSPSENASEALQLVGVKTLLVVDPPKTDGSRGARPAVALDRLLERLEPKPTDVKPAREIHSDQADYQVFPLAEGAGFQGRLVGDPGLLTRGRLSESDCHRIPFPSATFGLGVGALGLGFADCRERFGEFLAVGGIAAYLPTDASHTPDYLAAVRSGAPSVLACYALVCEGSPTLLTRFESHPDPGRASLGDIAEAGLDASGADTIGMVMIAETTGLIGASLRRSPALGAPATYAVPQIREWLSFTTDHIYQRSTVLAVGVASRGGEKAASLKSALRPLGAGSDLQGHFHAACFSYRPAPHGIVDMRQTVASVFEHQDLLSVLHLLGDDRAIGGVGQSDFLRGACWIAPLTTPGGNA
jgi:anti-anti-sigma factor